MAFQKFILFNCQTHSLSGTGRVPQSMSSPQKNEDMPVVQQRCVSQCVICQCKICFRCDVSQTMSFVVPLNSAVHIFSRPEVGQQCFFLLCAVCNFLNAANRCSFDIQVLQQTCHCHVIALWISFSRPKAIRKKVDTISADITCS